MQNVQRRIVVARRDSIPGGVLLAEDVFHLIEERGVAVRGLVFHFQGGAELLDQFALVARQLCWRQHTHVIVQIAFAAPARIGQSPALDAKNGAALRAFGNLQFFFPVQSRHRQLRTESSLRDAQGDGAIQIRAAAFEKRMFLNFEHDVQIARRPAVRPGLAFAGDTQPRSGIDARRNPQLNGLFAFEASLPAALRATLAHNLTRALARRACSRDGEESLLICQLTAAGARLAGLNASSLFRARAVARLAVFLARQLDFGGHARGGLFERERHVVSQIGPALRAAAPAAPAAPSKQVLEAKKIAEDVVEILEDGAVKSLAGAAAGKARVTVGVVDLPLLRITQHAVGFGAFAKLYFRFGFVFRTAVRMPFQSRLAVGGLDLVHRRRSCHAQNFVVIPLIPLRHGNFLSPLVYSFFGCGTRVHRYTHHGGTQHTP